jgi:hypothetical protein
LSTLRIAALRAAAICIAWLQHSGSRLQAPLLGLASAPEYSAARIVTEWGEGQ